MSKSKRAFRTVDILYIACVCAQLVKKRLTGYYVMYKGEKLVIRKDGRIKNPPDGFYDSVENSMRAILGF